MSRHLLPFGALAFLALASCVTLPPERPPRVDDPAIMGTEVVPLDQFLAFAAPRNPLYGRDRWVAIYNAYRDACRIEGVNLSVALVQMVHETNFLKFGGTVQASQNNFAGIGTVDKNTPGNVFPDVATGALAHVQHLKAYASTEPLATTLVDPRFRFVKRGVAPTIRSLTGKWAADPAYGEKLVTLWNRLRES